VPLLVLALLLFVILAFASVILLSFVLRYRAGTARRPGRRWVATFTMWMTVLSAIFFLIFAAALSFWMPEAFKIAFSGLLFGCLVGLLGLALTRWEMGADGMFYTPNRWLALFVTLALVTRVIYGWWRSFHPAVPSPGSFWILTASGKQLSLAIGAGMIGYYLVYNIGVRFRLAYYAKTIRQ